MATTKKAAAPSTVGVTASWQSWSEAIKRARITTGGRPVLPVLTAAYISKQGGEVTVRASNLEQFSETTMSGAFFDGDHPLCVNARMLAAALAGIRGDLSAANARCERINVMAHSHGAVTVSGFGRDLHLPEDALLPHEDYIGWPATPAERAAHLPAGALMNGFGFAQTACGLDDTLPMLTGVLIESQGERGFTFAATDRYRLAIIGVPSAATEPFEILVPAKVWPLIKDMRNAVDVFIKPGPDSGSITFVHGDVAVSTRLLETKFPAYKLLVPSEGGVWTIRRTELMGDVTAAASIIDRNAPVKLMLDSGKYQVDGSEIRGADSVDGGSWTAAFNPTFLLDGLKSFTSPTVEIMGTVANKPHVLRGLRHVYDATYLMMPVRLPG